METMSPITELGLRPSHTNSTTISFQKESFPLPLSKTNDNEKIKCILDSLPENFKLKCFLRLCGVLWRQQNEWIVVFCIQNIWNFILRILVFYVIYVGCADIAIGFYPGESISYDRRLYIICAGVAFFGQGVVLIPSLNSISRRLHSDISSYELSFVGKCLNLCLYMFIVSLILGGIGVYGLAVMTKANNTTTPQKFRFASLWLMGGSQFAISSFLSASLFFILLDCSVAVNLVDKLLVLHEEKDLCLEKFNLARSEIKTRVADSHWITYSLVVVAFMNMIGILFVVLFASGTDVNIGLLSMVFLREFPFLAIVLWQCATVNEKSDKLTKLLGSDAWDIEQTSHCNARVLLFINAESDRISFPLAGMRLNYRDIWRQLFAWIFALILGILKAIALS